MQDSFLRAYKQLARFDERASFGTWLYRIAVNCSLDLVRSRKRRNELMTPEDSEMDDPIVALPSHDPTPDRVAMSGRGPRPGGRGHDRIERLGTHRICTAAFRRHVYRRCKPRAGLPARRGQAQRISRGAEIEKGAGALGEYRKMNHLNEEQLILHYYGEADDAAPVPATPSPPSGIWKSAASAGGSTRPCSACSTWWMGCPCRNAPPTTARRCGSASSTASERGAVHAGSSPHRGAGRRPARHSRR